MRTATTTAGGILVFAIALAAAPLAPAARAAEPLPAVTGTPAGAPGAAEAPGGAVIPEPPRPAPKAPAAVPAPSPVRTGGSGTAPAAPLPQAPAPAAPPAAAGVAAAPAAESAGAAAWRASDDEETSWGLLLRGGYFGLPDALANKLFRQHPKVSGSSYGAEIRYHGDGGGRGVASVGLSVERCTSSADGIWQSDEFDKPIAASGDIAMTAATLTWYWSVLPSWWVHPYLGVGVGVAYLKGSYRNETDLTVVEYWVPAIHLPLGIAVELGDHVQLVAEGRFMNGVAAGGALQVRF